MNAANDQGVTPLHLASTAEMVSLFGAQIDAVTHDGFTPLHVAVCERGGSGAILALLERGADLNIPNKYGTIAVETARGRGDNEVLEMLLRFAR